MSSLDPKDAVADYSSLTEAQVKTLDQWESFFEKVRFFVCFDRGVLIALALQHCGTGQQVKGSSCSYHLPDTFAATVVKDSPSQSSLSMLHTKNTIVSAEP